MIKRTFLAEIHEDHGTLGLRPAWMPHADPYTGMAVAHDILEHFPKDDGGIEAELQAAGAMLWLRGKGGFWNSHYYPDPADHVSSEFPELYQHMRWEDFTLLDPGRTRRLDDEEAEDWCQRTATMGQRLVRQETRDEADDGHDLNDGDSFVELFCSQQSWQRIVGWMRRGYRRALRRYKNSDSYSLCNSVFIPIQKTADAWLKNAEEGMVLEVTVDLRNENVTMKGGYPPDPYAEDQFELDYLTLIY